MDIFAKRATSASSSSAERVITACVVLLEPEVIVFQFKFASWRMEGKRDIRRLLQ